MDAIKILKALSNEKRLQILGWLKTPEDNFPPHVEVEGFEQGVCVGFIKDKSGLSQSAASQYMSLLEDAGLVIATRIGKFTYYRRNEEAIAEFVSHMGSDL
jgi:ArsR family transcriptional regulator